MQCLGVGGGDCADQAGFGEEAAVDKVGGDAVGFEGVGAKGEDAGGEGKVDEIGLPLRKGVGGGRHGGWL